MVEGIKADSVLYHWFQGEEDEDEGEETKGGSKERKKSRSCFGEMMNCIEEDPVVCRGLQVEEDEEEGEEKAPKAGKGKRRSCFEEVLKCVEEDLKTRIIGRDYDDVALVLFNTVRC